MTDLRTQTRFKPATGGLLAGLAFALSFFPISALASGGDRIPGSRYISGRGAALGDAYIGLADTVADALFYNPSALGKLQKPTFEPLNLQTQTNSKLANAFDPDFYKFQSLEGYKSNLTSSPNTNPGGSYAILPAFGLFGFGFGALYQTRLMAESVGTNIRYRTTKQFIPSAGYGISLASGVLRMGYVLQWVNQVSGDVTKPAANSLDWSDGMGQGKGFSHNFAMAVTLPFQFQPSFNVVARNIGGLALKGEPMVVSAKNPSTTAIPEEEMSLDASFGFVMKIAAGWSLSPQFVYRDALGSTPGPTLSRTSAGLEFVTMDRFFFRGGYGNGYPSAGLGIRTSRAEANFSWFSEDLGTAEQKVRDLRYLFQFMFRAF